MKAKVFNFLILLTLIFSSVSQAQESFWTCDLIAELDGVPSSYLYHNRDYWTGHGELTCSRNDELIRNEIEIQYEGWASWTGISVKSKLTFFSYFIPMDHPHEVLKSFPTTSMGQVPTYYSFPVTTVLQVGRNRSFEMAVQVTKEQEENLHVPLDFGTLTISKKLKP